MKKHVTIGIAVAGLWLPLSSAAQQQTAGAGHHAVVTPHQQNARQQPAVGTQHHEAIQQSGAGARFVAAVETRTTTGRPYSAEAVNETVHVLADGNRINRLSVVRVYRDSAGRTRRETLNDDGSVRTIAISDPVSHTSLTLDPKTKIAYKRGGHVVAAPRTAGGVYTLTPSGTPGSRSSGGAASSGSGRGVGAAGVATVTRGGGSGTGGTIARLPLHDNANVTTEDVGPQNIEGVTAAGKRTTTIIPAGQIGNAQEIRIVSERWFSDDLEVLVLTKHSDPRSGETIYRLRNILRAEPDPSLFMVPADYTVQERR